MKRVLVAVAVLLSITILGGLWVLDRLGMERIDEILRRRVESSVPAEASIESLRLELLPPRIRLENASVRRNGRTLLRVERISVDLRLLDSLWEGQWVGDVQIEGAEIRVRGRDPDWRHVIENRVETLKPNRVQFRRAEIRFRQPEQGTRLRVRDLEADVLLGGFLSPRTDFAGHGRLEVSWSGRRATFRRAAIGGSASSDGVRLDSLLLVGRPGLIRVSGELSGGVVVANLDWTGSLEALRPLLPEEPPFSTRGRFHLVASAEGPLLEPTVDAAASFDDLGVGPWSGQAGLRFEGSSAGWEARAEIPALFEGSLVARASGTFETSRPVSGRLDLASIRVGSAAGLLEPRLPIEGLLDATLTVEGSIDSKIAEGEVEFRLAETERSADGRGRFLVGPDRLRIDGELTTAAGSLLRIRGERNGAALLGDLSLRTTNLAELASFTPWTASGEATLSATVVGPYGSPRLEGHVEGRSVEIEGVDLRTVEGRFVTNGREITIDELRARDGEATLRGRLAVRDPATHDWRLEIRETALRRLLELTSLRGWGIPDFEGALRANLVGSGPAASPEIVMDARIGGLSWTGVRVGDLTARIERRSDATWSVRSELRDASSGVASFRGRWADGSGAASLEARGWDLERALERAPASWPRVAGALSIEARLEGSIESPRGRGTIQLDEPIVGSTRFTRASLETTFGERIEVALDVDRALRVRGHGEWNDLRPFELDLDWTDLDLGGLVPLPSRSSLRSTGSGEIRGSLRRPLEAEGSLTVTSLRLESGKVRLENAAPVSLRIGDRAVSWERFPLAGGGRVIAVGGRLGSDPSWVSLEGVLDLGLLEVLVPQVGSVRGDAAIALEAERAVDGTWRPSGTIRLERAAIDVGLQIGVTDVVGDLEIDGAKVGVARLEGAIGGGSFAVDGTIDPRGGWDLRWRLEEANLGVPVWLDHRATGAGQVSGSIDAPEIGGEIRILQAVYDRPIEWIEFLPWFRRQIRASASPSVPVRLDLHLTSDGGLFVQNNLATAELEGDLRLEGPLGSLDWIGTLEVLDGTFVFRRRSFDITSGSVTFDPDAPRNPRIAFRGETLVVTETGDYAIRVEVSGTLRKPHVEFTGDDPTLSENDLLALVTFGKTIVELQNEGAGFSLDEVLSLTTGPYAGRVESGIHTILPVDRIEIEPSFSVSAGTAEPRLSIGKDVMRNLRALARTGLGEDRGQELALEYELTPRVAVEGQWESRTEEEAGTFGGEIRFRFPFWRVPSFSMLGDAFRRESGR